MSLDTLRKADSTSTMSEVTPSPRSRQVRQDFTEEYKAQAVHLGLHDRKSISAEARELDLSASAFGRRVAQARAVRRLCQV